MRGFRVGEGRGVVVGVRETVREEDMEGVGRGVEEVVG